MSTRYTTKRDQNTKKARKLPDILGEIQIASARRVQEVTHVREGAERARTGAARSPQGKQVKASDTAQMLKHAPALDEPTLHRLEEELEERHQLRDRTANLANLAKSTEAARSFAKIKWRQV